MANKVRKMTKDQAIREARVGSSYRGGTWYVTRKRDNYNVVPADMYDSARDGKVAETIDVHAERAARSTAKPAPANEPVRAATCLCVIGCSVNGECPVHGDGGHLPSAADVRRMIDVTPDGLKTPDGVMRVA